MKQKQHKKRKITQRILGVFFILVLFMSMQKVDSFFSHIEAKAAESKANHMDLRGNGTEDEPYLIENEDELRAVTNAAEDASLTGNYKLIADITLEKAWTPIGSEKFPFAGTFDGNGHKISKINFSVSERFNYHYLGMFGFNNGTIKNLNCYMTTKAKKSSDGDYFSGSLVGYNQGTISNCYTEVEIAISTSSYTQQYHKTGGLVGYNSGTISNCYVTGKVSFISGSHGVYAYTGGLAGSSTGIISNCYAKVETEDPHYYKYSYSHTGGLAGSNKGTISNCYTIGKVSSDIHIGIHTDIGGLVGKNSGTVSNCYFNSQNHDNEQGTSKSLDEMKLKSTFEGWDFETVWGIDPDINDGYPYLRDTIYSSNTPDDTVLESGSFYFTEWDANTRLLKDTIPGAITSGISTLVTDATVIDGADSPKQLLNQYVWAEYYYDGGCNVLTHVKPLDSRIGVVTALSYAGEMGWKFTIDGSEYTLPSNPDELSPQNEYSEMQYKNKKVFYHLNDGKLIKILPLSLHTGIFESKTDSPKELMVDGKCYSMWDGTVSHSLKTGDAVGFYTVTPNIIIQIEKRRYETKVGTLEQYNASAHTAVLDGVSIKIHTEECTQDLTPMTGKKVFYLLANGEIVHIDMLSKANYQLIVSDSFLGIVGYENGLYTVKNGTAKIHLSNRMPYQFPRFYDQKVVDEACSKVPVTIQSFVWEAGKGVKFQTPELVSLTLKPGEDVNKSVYYTIEGYTPMEKSESIISSLNIAYKQEGSSKVHSAKGSYVLRINNYDKLSKKPTYSEEDNNTADLASAAYDELDKVIGAVSLRPDIMEEMFSIKGEALQQFQKEILSAVVLSNTPKKSFQGKVEDDIFSKVFGKYKPKTYISAVGYTVPLNFTILSQEYGILLVKFNCKVLKMGLSGESIYVTVNYEIQSSERSVSEEKKTGVLGGGASADVSAFSEAAFGLVEAGVKEAYNETWGKSADEVADFLFNDTVKAILKAKKTSAKDVVWNIMTWPAKNLSIHCPVDVYVYNAQGNLCGFIENNIVTNESEDFILSVECDTKYIIGMDYNYTVKYVATGDGLMDVEITEYMGTDTPARHLMNFSIPLQQNGVYIQQIPEAIQPPIEEYQLVSETNQVFPVDITEILYTPTLTTTPTIAPTIAPITPTGTNSPSSVPVTKPSGSGGSTGGSSGAGGGAAAGGSAVVPTSTPYVKPSPALGTVETTKPSQAETTKPSQAATTKPSQAETTKPSQTATTKPSQVATWEPSVIVNSETGPDSDFNYTSKEEITSADVILSKKTFVYNGKEKKPSVIVMDGPVKLIKNLDYTVEYLYNKKIGTAYVLVYGKGDYYGNITKSFKIVPKGTSITGRPQPGYKAFTVKWKKQPKSITGYQIQYSVNKKFKGKTTVIKTVKKKSVTKLKAGKLKAKKKYYVRVRTYKTARGRKYYSRWSKASTVKTKK